MHPAFGVLSDGGVEVDIGPFAVHVRSDHPQVAHHLALLYEPEQFATAKGSRFDVTVAAATGVRRYFRQQAKLFVNGREPFLPLPADLAGPLLEWGLNWSLGQRCYQWVAVHAAVVERDGAALILSAPSGSGKSTLCAELVYRGWRLLSDEFALIDCDTGRLVPCPRPISLKDASIEIVRRRHPHVVMSSARVDIEGARFVHARPPVDSVRRAREAVTAQWLVFPKYTAAHRTELEPVLRARALVEVADQSFNYNYLGQRGFSALAKLIGSVQTFTFEYSDLDEAVACFSQLPTA